MNTVTSQGNDDRVLHCWKEIAMYLSAGVRTVQRWESEFSLPVRRPRGTKRSAVLAFSSEIDEWIRNLPVALRASSVPSGSIERDGRVGFRVADALVQSQVRNARPAESHP
jgi:hypothetical protein